MTPSGRSRRWVIFGVFAVLLGVAIPISTLNLIPGSAGMALTASSLFFLSAFAAFNFDLRTTRICVISLWMGLGLGLLAGGRHQIGSAWLVFGFAAIIGAEWLCRGVTSVRKAAVTDPLTGLLNRTGLWEECDRAITFCQRNDQPLTLVHIDLDGFKEANDREGHAEGDRILRLCAQRWAGVVRSADILARYGGDEFLVVLPGTDAEEVPELMERLRVVSPIEWCYGSAQIRPGEEIQACIDRADNDLYAAKRKRSLSR